MNVIISCKQSFESKRLVTNEQEPFFKMKSVCYILASTEWKLNRLYIRNISSQFTAHRWSHKQG